LIEGMLRYVTLLRQEYMRQASVMQRKNENEWTRKGKEYMDNWI